MPDDSPARGAPEPRHGDDYDGPRVARSGGSLWGVLPWLLGGLIVLLLAVLAGLGAAYLIATSNAVPTPRTVVVSPTAPPTPRLTELATATPGASPTDGPPSPTVTPEPEPGATPLVHVVRRGESISLIAAEYGVTIEEIIELNDLENPDVIVPGQELLIPTPSD